MSGGPVPVFKKYTTGSTGIWEKIRQVLTLVPNRSSGNPLVQYYRVPPPGSHPKAITYVDPTTIPAGDIKSNAYRNRDHRRNYPQMSSFNQSKLSGLLELGSASNPRVAKGDEGFKQLAVFKEGDVSLASTLVKLNKSGLINGEVLGPKGEPVIAPSLNKVKWTILRENVHGMYEDDWEKYPCRIFTNVKA
ncbi:hypothetical protein BABINDRAFT_65443 [Babjeviella inositovora NRRL Y-12698]|uniref:Uncharacterized protein n=1 Tax=Babjeviella inositovora NRRL Y-12698 TaxID=984486 RepID=A0A1E3QKE2_9ASCO|nr:uncharacterized protein BABINDRAFT_65443 [Babjeviella inositovora NRRL Y-12698]ODQ78155.1 hypothetical protein BABINDRAFT_65443 [Babjeviella inositovora NRRL Y-12698]